MTFVEGGYDFRIYDHPFRYNQIWDQSSYQMPAVMDWIFMLLIDNFPARY